MLILIPSALAIGISPAIRTIEYVPGSEYTFTDTISNNRDVPIEVVIEPTGQLAPYITLHKNYTTLPPKGSAKISYDFVIPDGLEPGNRKVLISVTDDTQRGGGMFGIKVRVKGVLIVKVPYPGRYAMMRLDVENVNEGESIAYTVDIENMGLEPINTSTLRVNLIDSQGKVLKVNTHEVEIDSKSKTQITSSFPGEYGKGKYSIFAEYEYDLTINDSMDFFIGAYEMEITRLSEHLYYNQITPFETVVKSLWNGEIADVYVTVSLNGKEHQSVNKYFYPLDSEKFTTYIDDTSFALNKTYDATVTVYFGEQSLSKDVTLDVVEYDGKVILEKPTRSAIFDDMLEVIIKPTTYLYVVIAILVIFNITLLWKDKKKGKKK